MRSHIKSTTSFIDMPAHTALVLEAGRDGDFVAFHDGRIVILNGMPNEYEASRFGLKLEAGAVVFVNSDLKSNPRNTVWFADVLRVEPAEGNVEDVPAILPRSIADRASCPEEACIMFNGEGLNTLIANYMVWSAAEAIRMAEADAAAEVGHAAWLAKREAEEAPARAAAAAERAAVVAIHGEAVAAFADSLKVFDSYYGYSDDIRVYRSGKETETALLAVKATLSSAQIQAAFGLAGKSV